MSSLIQLKDINKYYGEGKEKLHVLKSLNMEIETRGIFNDNG